MTWIAAATDPLGVVVPLGDLPGRVNIADNAAGSAYGVWIMHLVVAGEQPCSVTIGRWAATGRGNSNSTFEYPSFNTAHDPTTFTVPAPGAAGALVLAGAHRRCGASARA